jgi:fatty acid desaturase
MLVLMNEVACMMRGDGDGDVRWQVSHGQRHAHTRLDENDAEPKGHKACTGEAMRALPLTRTVG